MSLPETDAEQEQLDKTLAARFGTENVVSTACPECGTKFAMLTRFASGDWGLRCTVCGVTAKGELK